jgi:hypothetical protein
MYKEKKNGQQSKVNLNSINEQLDQFSGTAVIVTHEEFD